MLRMVSIIPGENNFGERKEASGGGWNYRDKERTARLTPTLFGFQKVV